MFWHGSQRSREWALGVDHKRRKRQRHKLKLSLSIAVLPIAMLMLLATVSPTNPAAAQADLSCSVLNGEVSWQNTPSWATAQDVLHDGKVVRHLGAGARSWTDPSPGTGTYQIKAKAGAKQVQADCKTTVRAEAIEGFRLLIPPTLTKPVNNAVLKSTATNRLTINPDYVLARGAVLTWQIFPEGQASNAVWNTNTTSTQKSVDVPAGKLRPNTRYQWQVSVAQGCPFGDCLIKKSAIQRFRTEAVTPNPPPPDSCLSTVALTRPTITAGGRAKFAGSTFTVAWNSVNCASEYHYKLTVNGQPFADGATRSTKLSHGIGPRHGRICITLIAANGGRRPDSPSTTPTANSCAYKPAPTPTNPRTTVPPPTPTQNDPCVSSVQLNNPRIGSLGRAKVLGSTFRVSWKLVSCATEYHYKLTVDGRTFAQSATKVPNLSHGIGPRYGRICVSIIAVNGGKRPDSPSTTHPTYGCVFRPAPTPTNPRPTNPPPTSNPCVSNVRLGNPGFGALHRAKITGSTFSINWKPVTCANEYHYKLTVNGQQFAQGARKISNLSHGIGPRYGRICVSIIAVNGGKRPDSPSTTHPTYGCVFRPAPPTPNPPRREVVVSAYCDTDNTGTIKVDLYNDREAKVRYDVKIDSWNTWRGIPSKDSRQIFHRNLDNGTYRVTVKNGSALIFSETRSFTCQNQGDDHVCGRDRVAELYGRPGTGIQGVKTDFECVYVTDGFLVYYNTTANVAYTGQSDRSAIEDLAQKVENAWELYGCANVASLSGAPVKLDCRAEDYSPTPGWGMRWPRSTTNWPEGSRTATEGLRFPITVGGQHIPADGFSLPSGIQFRPKENIGGTSGDTFSESLVLHEVFHTFQWAQMVPGQLLSPNVNAAVESMADFAAARAMGDICRGKCTTPAQFAAGRSDFPWSPAYRGEYWYYYLLEEAPKTQRSLPTGEGPFFNSLLAELSSARVGAGGSFENLYGDSIVDDYRVWAGQWP